MGTAKSRSGKGSGWHLQSQRHSNARKTGKAGGSYKGQYYALMKVKKLQEDLAKLDAQYLTNYPKPMSRTTYLKKRNILRKRFNELKNTLR